MAWETYEPGKRGRQPRDFAAIVADIADGEDFAVDYASEQSAKKLRAALLEAADVAGILLAVNILRGTGENAGQYRVVASA